MLHDSDDSSKKKTISPQTQLTVVMEGSHIHILFVATAGRPRRPTPYPAESFEGRPTDGHGRRILIGTKLPTCGRGVCIESVDGGE